jgi:hypothetical protein
MRDPGTFRHEIEALPRGSWVVVDEVQKLPSLLNEIRDARTPWISLNPQGLHLSEPWYCCDEPTEQQPQSF